MALLKQTIRPEFLNRIDEVIMFQPLMKKEIKGIIKIQLENFKKLVEQNAEYNWSSAIMPWSIWPKMVTILNLVQGHLNGLIQKEIVNPLSKRILAGDIDKTKPVLVDVFDGVVVFRNDIHEVVES